MLNAVWFGMFASSALAALYRWYASGDTAVFAAMAQSLFDSAKLSVDLILVLLGNMTLWLGVLRVAERAGVVRWLARGLDPLFAHLLPEVPRRHPALGLITMNFAANILGLDNAATPVGLRAMRELQTLNPHPDTATNAQIVMMVLNASSLTLLPVSIFMYRAQQGAPDPALVFLPILLATSASTLTGLLAVAWMQRLRLHDPVVLAYLGGAGLLLGTAVAGLASLSAAALAGVSALVGNLALIVVLILFLLLGVLRRVPVYEAFIDGAKEAFEVARDLLPYVVAMLVAVGMLRSSGMLDQVLAVIAWCARHLGLNTDFVAAMPNALMKPFSGNAARALLIETMQRYGVDSYPALVAATVQGSTETTFYVAMVYFGAVGVRRLRHAVGCALLADVAGIVASIAVCSWFFGAH